MNSPSSTVLGPARSTAARRARQFGSIIAGGVLGLSVLFAASGCNDNSQDRIRRTQQSLDVAKTKSDSLHDATRYLAQMTPQNRSKVELEVQLHLNKWWGTAEKQQRSQLAADLIEGLPPDLRSDAEFATVGDGQFDLWDIEYLYQSRIYRQLATWIAQRPLHDSLLNPWLEAQSKTLPPEQYAQLDTACKLFDWSVRNIVLTGNAKDIERLVDDPRKPVVDSGTGYRYLPWQTALFGQGDFIDRGRTFTALAQQRDLQTCWIALRLPTSPAPKLWTIGVWIGDDCYLFDPKLGMPIIHPESLAPATLAQVRQDERILRRLDVPGLFDYAVNPGDAKSVEFLLEIEPSAGTNRMSVLESSLTGDDRLRLQTDFAPLIAKLKRLMPDSQVSLWQIPLLSRIYAKDLRVRLTMNTPFTAEYMVEHAAWFMNTPLSVARLKHLAGEFENTFDTRGALATYMDCRAPNEQIDLMLEDPDVAKELGIPRFANESMEEFLMRLSQMQIMLKRAKIDASFLLGQLNFDLGKYGVVEDWMQKRTLGNSMAIKWHPAARYTLARAYEQQNQLPQAIEALNADGSPMEPGNRLRVRYLSK